MAGDGYDDVLSYDPELWQYIICEFPEEEWPKHADAIRDTAEFARWRLSLALGNLVTTWWDVVRNAALIRSLKRTLD